MISKVTKLILSESESCQCAKAATKIVLYAKSAKRKGRRAYSQHYGLVYLVLKKGKFASGEQLSLYKKGIVNLAICQHVRC